MKGLLEYLSLVRASFTFSAGPPHFNHVLRRHCPLLPHWRPRSLLSPYTCSSVVAVSLHVSVSQIQRYYPCAHPQTLPTTSSCLVRTFASRYFLQPTWLSQLLQPGACRLHGCKLMCIPLHRTARFAHFACVSKIQSSCTTEAR